MSDRTDIAGLPDEDGHVRNTAAPSREPVDASPQLGESLHVVADNCQPDFSPKKEGGMLSQAWSAAWAAPQLLLAFIFVRIRALLDCVIRNQKRRLAMVMKTPLGQRTRTTLEWLHAQLTVPKSLVEQFALDTITNFLMLRDAAAQTNHIWSRVGHRIAVVRATLANHVAVFCNTLLTPLLTLWATACSLMAGVWLRATTVLSSGRLAVSEIRARLGVRYHSGYLFINDKLAQWLDICARVRRQVHSTSLVTHILATAVLKVKTRAEQVLAHTRRHAVRIGSRVADVWKAPLLAVQ